MFTQLVVIGSGLNLASGYMWGQVRGGGGGREGGYVQANLEFNVQVYGQLGSNFDQGLSFQCSRLSEVYDLVQIQSREG